MTATERSSHVLGKASPDFAPTIPIAIKHKIVTEQSGDGGISKYTRIRYLMRKTARKKSGKICKNETGHRQRGVGISGEAGPVSDEQFPAVRHRNLAIFG